MNTKKSTETTKKSNIGKIECRGLKEVKERVKPKEIVVFSTDKTGQFTVDTATNYEEALNEHIEKDTEVNEKKVRELEKKCNDHLKQFNKMFSVGATFGHQGRVANASTATNVPAPPLRGIKLFSQEWR